LIPLERKKDWAKEKSTCRGVMKLRTLTGSQRPGKRGYPRDRGKKKNGGSGWTPGRQDQGIQADTLLMKDNQGGAKVLI